ncbi:Hypp6363 [Branchiostoma lanceolatum]|uniref:Hypp6363 protein n=1 Tax=Branchiostoma lanceolatum TaxID=7740 RepID=A0A8K0E3K2_BRALA|nr:Hypp6363 [Branchiostoma lanceolatum]
MAAAFWLTCCVLVCSMFYGAADGHSGIATELETSDGLLPKGDLMALLVSRQAEVDPCLLPNRLRPPSCMRQYGRYYKRMPLNTNALGKLREAANKHVRTRPPMW